MKTKKKTTKDPVPIYDKVICNPIKESGEKLFDSIDTAIREMWEELLKGLKEQFITKKDLTRVNGAINNTIKELKKKVITIDDIDRIIKTQLKVKQIIPYVKIEADRIYGIMYKGFERKQEQFEKDFKDKLDEIFEIQGTYTKLIEDFYRDSFIINQNIEIASASARETANKLKIFEHDYADRQAGRAPF